MKKLKKIFTHLLKGGVYCKITYSISHNQDFPHIFFQSPSTYKKNLPSSQTGGSFNPLKFTIMANHIGELVLLQI